MHYENGQVCMTHVQLESEVTELSPMLVCLSILPGAQTAPPFIFVDWHASDVKNKRSPQREGKSFGTPALVQWRTMNREAGRQFMLHMKVRVKSGLVGTGGVAH